jgi:hypothetical protein
MNPNSNCFYWRTYLQQAYESTINIPDQVTILEKQVRSLDLGLQQWCNSQQGLQSYECTCISFPTLQKAQCTAQSTFCQYGETNTDCLGRVFTRVSDGCSGEQTSCCLDPDTNINIPCAGTYLEITLGKCVPYFCWVAECTFGATQLLTSNIVASTQNGTCNVGTCINVQGTDLITITDAAFTPNKDSANYTPGYAIIGSCGVDQFPFPNLLPTIYTLPVDQVSPLPVAITNSGDSFLQLYLDTDASQPTIDNIFPYAFAPTIISVGAKSVSFVQITFDIQILQKYWLIAYQGGLYPNVKFSSAVKEPSPGLLPAVSWTYTYRTPQGGTQYFYLSIGDVNFDSSPILGLTLTYPVNAPLPVQPIPVTPWYSYIILIITASFFILMLLRTWNFDSKIINIRNETLNKLKTTEMFYYPK